MDSLRRLRKTASRKVKTSKLSEEKSIARNHEMAIALEKEMFKEAQKQHRSYPELRLGVDDIDERYKSIDLDSRLSSRNQRRHASKTPCQYYPLHDKNSIRFLIFRH